MLQWQLFLLQIVRIFFFVCHALSLLSMMIFFCLLLQNLINDFDCVDRFDCFSNIFFLYLFLTKSLNSLALLITFTAKYIYVFFYSFFSIFFHQIVWMKIWFLNFSFRHWTHISKLFLHRRQAKISVSLDFSFFYFFLTIGENSKLSIIFFFYIILTAKKIKCCFFNRFEHIDSLTSELKARCVDDYQGSQCILLSLNVYVRTLNALKL